MVAEPPVEVWTLDHPRLGVLVAYIGSIGKLIDIDPDFPSQASILNASVDATDTTTEGGEADEAATQRLADLAAKGQRITQRFEKRLGLARTERLRSWAHRDANWRPRALLITRNGVPIVRLGSLSNAKVRLATSMPAGRLTSSTTVSSGSRIVVEVAAPGRFVTGIRIHDDDEVVAFDPPAGSPGQQRLDAMDASPWKRVAYPLAAGLGKAGWALWVLIIGPVIGKLLDPVFAFLAWVFGPIARWIADHWPRIPWPKINLPDIPWPRIPWPHLDLPDVPWPSWTPPGWLAWMLEHPKTWTPLILAVFFAVMAVRNNKRSRETKAAWEAERRHRELTRLAAAMREVVDAKGDGRPSP